MKKIFVLFPYLSLGEIHPWIENQIKSFEEAGFQVRIYPQIKYKKLYKNLFLFLINLPKIIITIFKSDHLLLSASFLTSFYVPFFKILGRKIILTHVATVAYPSLRVFLLQKNKKLSLFFRKLDSLSYRLADCIFTYAYSIADDLTKNHQLKKGKVHIIETLVDTKIFASIYTQEVKKIKKDLGIKNKDILLYHGQYHPWHGLDYFFKATPLLLKENPNFAFIMMGVSREDLKKIYPQKILDKSNFYFPGRVSYKRLPQYIQMADLWFGRFAESSYPALGNCVVEAMACAKPVILYKTPEHTRLLTDKKDAIFVNAANPRDIYEKISFYFRNPKNKDKLKKIGQNARRTALRKFSVKSFSKKLKKIFN